jgi:hypothetical protein
MPINTVVPENGAISGRTATNKAIRSQFAESISKLQFASLWRGPGTLVKGPPRIDAQGPWTEGPGKNIQGQLGNNTFAAIRIANTLQDVDVAGQATVLQAAQNALNASCADGNWREITGTVP